MKTLFKFALVFLILSIATALLPNWMDISFGDTDYFQKHGWLFLLFISLFPRLTLLFSSVPFGGLFWWLGFFFAPRLLVAILATVAYWETNPYLVTISWLIAWGGESGEKYVVVNRYQKRKKPAPAHRGDVIDVEYKKL